MESSVCQEGNWDIGNAILLALCTLMMVLPSDGTAAKGVLMKHRLSYMLLHKHMDNYYCDFRFGQSLTYNV